MNFYPVRPPSHALVPAPKGAQGEWGLRVAWGRARRRGPEFEQTGDSTIFVVASSNRYDGSGRLYAAYV